MKNKMGLRALAILIFFTAAAWAQSNDSKASAPTTQVAVARCAYSHADTVCQPAAEHVSGDSSLAQIPRRGPGSPMHPGPYMRRPGVGYADPYPWPAPEYNHAGMGALIGFGLGAAAGASTQTDVRGRVAASLAEGCLFGLLGGAIGHAIPAFHFRRQYDPGEWPDDDDQAEASNRKPIRRRASLPARALPSASAAPLPANPLPLSVTNDTP
jgi:hypothetical protein